MLFVVVYIISWPQYLRQRNKRNKVSFIDKGGNVMFNKPYLYEEGRDIGNVILLRSRYKVLHSALDYNVSTRLST